MAQWVHLKSLSAAGWSGELPETGDTLEHNAREKASWIRDRLGVWVMAEDSGLFVDALNGEPGVYSARYAGVGASPTENTHLLLEKLGQRADRTARFKTVIALWHRNNWTLFQGACEGWIGHTEEGKGGFGYDPVFYPQLADGNYSDRSFARMSREEKAGLSHRGKAVQALLRYFRDQEPG